MTELSRRKVLGFFAVGVVAPMAVGFPGSAAAASPIIDCDRSRRAANSVRAFSTSGSR